MAEAEQAKTESFPPVVIIAPEPVAVGPAIDRHDLFTAAALPTMAILWLGLLLAAMWFASQGE